MKNIFYQEILMRFRKLLVPLRIMLIFISEILIKLSGMFLRTYLASSIALIKNYD